MISDPPRLTALGGRSADLLRVAKEDAPSDSARRRAALAIGLSVGAAAGAVALTAATTTAASAGSKVGAIGGTALVAKWIGVTIVGTVIAAGTVAYVEPQRFFAAAPTVVPTEAAPASGRVKKGSGSISGSTAPGATGASPTSVSPDQQIPEAVAAASPSPTLAESPAAPAAVTSSASSASSAPTLADEVRLLDQARGKIASGDAQGALATLALYKKTIPNGMLAPESAVLQVQALHQLGDDTSAREAGNAFLTAHPTSPQARRIRSILDHLPHLPPNAPSSEP